MERGPDALGVQPGLDDAQVAVHHRRDVGVDDRRARAPVLLDLGRDLARDRDVDARRALADDRRDPLLVRVVDVRVEEADGHRLDAVR